MIHSVFTAVMNSCAEVCHWLPGVGLSSLCCLVFTTLPLARYDIVYLSPTLFVERSKISYSYLKAHFMTYLQTEKTNLYSHKDYSATRAVF